ncbi:type III secretion system gatekeeper subunit SctW [Erwiniaceae bacterium BAC15a-03b]|uniref:Type III secretion system gatekeeper subunit SctW n=1 Tax=Winslowiella arboricola TaxID=2978220 RepID=A0A9J6PUG6_9GAMM|nr:type III secretion system gatekeeper subunit SctW [Winslowiella arboricola]MCU5773769.1 type III secretion system gatekeeper subunit SctW [Winslowiella arboricola]MCU5777679.1 type III secretion system gatekeeper subunit SctW [Winslowiella arboricola]
MTEAITSSSTPVDSVRPGRAPGNTGHKSILSANLHKPLANDSSIPARTADDDGTIVTAEKFLASVDELSALVAGLNNRRSRERSNDFYATAEVYELLEDDPGARLDALWRILRVSGINNIALLLQQLKALFPDVSDRLVALRQMLRQRNLAETERELIEQAIATLIESENPKHLKSGINVALKARLFGKALNLSPAIIRESYRHFIESDETEREIYLHWVLMFGGSRRHMVINFMESAVLADMNASDPGCSAAEFGDLLGRLTQIKIIRSSDHLFIKCASNDQFIGQFAISEDQWLLFLLPLLKAGDLLYQQLEQLAGGVIMRQPTRRKVSFVQKIFKLIAAFPAQIYDCCDQQEILHQHFITLIDHGYSQEMVENRGY